MRDRGPGADAASDRRSRRRPAGDVRRSSTRAMSADELAAGALDPTGGTPAATPSTTADARHADARGDEAQDARCGAATAQGGRAGGRAQARHAKEQAKQERKAAKAARQGRPPTAVAVDPGEASDPSPPIDPLTRPDGRAPGAASGVRRRRAEAAAGGPHGDDRSPTTTSPTTRCTSTGTPSRGCRGSRRPARGRGGRSTIVIDAGRPGIDAVRSRRPRRRTDRPAAAAAPRRRAPCRRPQAAEVAGRGHDACVVRRRRHVAVLGSSLFDVRDVEVQGAEYTDGAASTPSSTTCDGRSRSCSSTPERRARAGGHPVGRVRPGRPRTSRTTCSDRHPRAHAGRHVCRAPTGVPGASTTTAGCSTVVVGGRPSTYLSLVTDAADSGSGQFAGRRIAAAASCAVACPTSSARSPRRSASTRRTNDLTLELDANARCTSASARRRTSTTSWRACRVALAEARPRRGRADPTHRRLERRRHLR